MWTGVSAVLAIRVVITERSRGQLRARRPRRLREATDRRERRRGKSRDRNASVQSDLVTRTQVESRDVWRASGRTMPRWQGRVVSFRAPRTPRDAW